MRVSAFSLHSPHSHVFRQRLIADTRESSLTTVQATEIQKRRTALLTRIQKFAEAQHIFMPGLRSFLKSHRSSDDKSAPEHMKVYLPSSIPVENRQHVCSSTLVDIESRLRVAHAAEALSGLRRQLRTRMMAQKLNDKHAASQRAYVRSKALQDQVESRIRSYQRQYNMAREAVLALRGPGDSEAHMPELKPEDVRGINERSMTAQEKREQANARRMAGLPEDGGVNEVEAVPLVAFDPRLALGEGQRRLSWIWYSVGEGELHEGSPEVEASGLPTFRFITETHE